MRQRFMLGGGPAIVPTRWDKAKACAAAQYFIARITIGNMSNFPRFVFDRPENLQY
jgi:hypothetical protein